MKKLLILDLDHTIRKPLTNSTFITHPTDQQLISEALSPLLHYQAEGWVMVGATNQAGVSSGFKTLQQAIEEQRYTIWLLEELDIKLSEILLCPDFEGQLCYSVTSREWKTKLKTYLEQNFRKPNTGMVEILTHAYKPDSVMFVGDMETDRECANMANVPFMWAKDFYNI